MKPQDKQTPEKAVGPLWTYSDEDFNHPHILPAIPDEIKRDK